MDSEIQEETTHLRWVLFPAFSGLAGLVFFTYGSSLTFGFMVNSDDQAYIFRNPYLLDLSLSNLRAIFTHVHFDSYLPMTLASYSLDYSFWKFQSFGYHLTQLVLHLANSFLILVVLLLSRFPKRVAVATAFIYSVHPVHAESVVWVSERKNLLSAFFILLSLMCYIRYGRTDSVRYYMTALFFFILALLSKSIAVMLPLIFILHDLCLADRGWRLIEKTPFFIASLATAGITVLTQGAVGAIKEYPGGDLPATALFMLRIFWDYLFSLVLPFWLSPEYHYAKADFWEWQSLLAYAIIPVALVLALFRYRTRPLYAFLAGWFLLWLLPVSNIVPLATLRQDRYLYLPAIAVAIFFAQTALACFPIKSRNPFGSIVVGMVVLILANLAHNHSITYASDRAVRLRIAEAYPRWSDAQFELGYQCWLEKDLHCASLYYRKAIETDPQNAQALMNMGAILIEQGDYHQAKTLLERALAAAPDSPFPYHNLAVIAMKTGEDKDKIPQWIKKSEELSSLEKKKDYRLGEFRFKP